jgi:hypothetical protein
MRWNKIEEKERLCCKICNRDFKNYNGLSNHMSTIHKMKLFEYVDKFYEPEECECGCGNVTNFANNTGNYNRGFPRYNNYIVGHTGITKKAIDATILANTGRTPKNKIIFGKKEIDKILKYYENGWSMKVIAKFMNVGSNRSIRRVILENKDRLTKNPVAKKSILEYLVMILLEDMGEEYIHQHYMPLPDGEWIRKRGPIFDFFLPKHKLVIECDGERWHKGIKDRDDEQCVLAKRYGYSIVRFSGNIILKQLDEVKQQISEQILMKKDNINA